MGVASAEIGAPSRSGALRGAAVVTAAGGGGGSFAQATSVPNESQRNQRGRMITPEN